MSTLLMAQRRNLDEFLCTSSGDVLNLTNLMFGELVFETVGLDIHDEKYISEGKESNADKLRAFWKLESDSTVGKLLIALIDHYDSLGGMRDCQAEDLANTCRQIAMKLCASRSNLNSLKEHVKVFNAIHLAEQIRRMEASVEADPSLAIGTAKEIVETCCKTILAERGKPISGTPDISTLTKETLKALKLVPEEISDAAKGAEVIKRLLSNLGTIGNGLAELRGLYGTGHGKQGNATGLRARHARLAVGAAATLATFLFETHKETKS